MSITELNLAEFAAKKYTLVTQLVPESDRIALYQRALERSTTKTMKPDTRVPGAPAASADPCMEELLEKLLPAIERITQRQLFPTYSYFRVYKTGDVLERHIDRPACEISVSINLGYRAAEPWPIWVEGPEGASSFRLQPGDAVVYRGIECPHWREAFTGEFAAQVFLHYVDQHGPRAEWKFDKRRRLGTIPLHPIRISKHIPSLQSTDVMDAATGAQTQMDPFLALVLKDLEAECVVPAIVRHVMDKFRVSEFEAEAATLRLIALLEDRGILVIDSGTEKLTA
jgi:hypothetical protein